MSFNENDVNRDKGGKFDTKTGSAPGIQLDSDFSGLSSEDVQERILDQADQRSHDADGGGFDPRTLDEILRDEYPDVSTLDPAEEPLPDISDTSLPDIDGFDPHAHLRTPVPPLVESPAGYVPATKADDAPRAQQNVQEVTELLSSGNLADNGITSDDLGKLREAIDRAEYNLVDNEIKGYLAANHPEVKGILIETDGYDSPTIVGLEIEDGSEQLEGRNYGTVIPFDERHQELYAHLYNYSESIAQFQDRGSFDEYATVLTDDTEEYGRFRGLYGDEATDSPVYRIAGRSA